MALEVGGEERTSKLSQYAAYLLALLVLHSPEPRTRLYLAESLWPDYDNSDDDAIKRRDSNFRSQLRFLRSALDSAATRLSDSNNSLSLDLIGAYSDIRQLRDSLQAARVGRPEALKAAITENPALMNAELMPGCALVAIDEFRPQLEQWRRDALDLLARDAESRGNVRDAENYLNRLWETDPVDFDIIRRQVTIKVQSSNIPAAIQILDRYSEDAGSGASPEARIIRRRLEGLSTPPSTERARLQPPPPPLPRTTLIGRGPVLDRLAGLILNNRIVTLVGAGGIGKTRLSLASADRLRPAFRDGVAFIDLAVLIASEREEAVTAAICRALGITARSLDALAEELSDRDALLIFDNAEHVLDTLRGVLPRLLNRGRGCQALVTSRESLRLLGEQAYPVPALSDEDAVTLFLHRAPLPLPPETAAEKDAMAEICRRVGNLPLGIELAAAAVDRQPNLVDLAEELRTTFAYLERWAIEPGLPERTRTLHLAIRWSYDLLDEPVQKLFRASSCLLGGGDKAALAALAQVTPAIAEQLANRLAASSLAERTGADSDARWRLSEPVRELADKLLAEGGEKEVATLRHRTFFMERTEAFAPRLTGADSSVWFGKMEEDRANAEGALARALGEHDHTSALRLAISLATLWHLRGSVPLGRRWLGQALDSTQASEAIAPALRLAGLVWNGNLAYDERVPEASEWFGQALELARQQKNLLAEGRALGGLGLAAMVSRNFDEARRYFQEAEAIFKELGDEVRQLQALDNIALNAVEAGNWEEAGEIYARTIPALRERRLKVHLVIALNNFARYHLGRGDIDTARALTAEALTMAVETGNIRGCVQAMALAVRCAIETRLMETGAELLGALKEERRTRGIPVPPNTLAAEGELRMELVAAIGQDRFDALVAAGSGLNYDDRVALALKSLKTRL